MFVTSIALKGFRCFESQKISFEAPITLIEGANGSGKTSFLEALHYACYLRSFRTHLPKEMVKFDSQAFSIKLEGFTSQTTENEPIELKIGFSGTQRKVNANGKAMSSYKELIELYRVITIIEDDVMLVKGTPELRRTFMDQAVFLVDPGHASLLRRYKKVLKQRNALLASSRCDKTSYTIWTEQLEELTESIQNARAGFLSNLESSSNELLKDFFGFSSKEPSSALKLKYRPKQQEDQLFEKERLFKRSLFGAHLDDCQIIYCDRNSKRFASRGQQKLIVMLLKIAQLKLLQKPAIVLIDDFMTDFDQERIKAFLLLLTSCQSQLIFTCPVASSCLNTELETYNFSRIRLKQEDFQETQKNSQTSTG